jgi:hypothetical protein
MKAHTWALAAAVLAAAPNPYNLLTGTGYLKGAPSP